MNSASLCSLAGRYDNPIPPRFLAPIDFLKIPAQHSLKSDTSSLLSIELTTPYCGGRVERGIIMPLGEEGGVWEAFGDKL